MMKTFSDFYSYLFDRKPPDLEEQKRLGSKAQLLWDSPEFQRAIRAVRVGIHEKWANAPLEDQEGQLTLRLMLKLLNDVEGNIRKEMTDGKFAEITIKDQQAKEKRSSSISLFNRN